MKRQLGVHQHLFPLGVLTNQQFRDYATYLNEKNNMTSTAPQFDYKMVTTLTDHHRPDYNSLLDRFRLLSSCVDGAVLLKGRERHWSCWRFAQVCRAMYLLRSPCGSSNNGFQYTCRHGRPSQQRLNLCRPGSKERSENHEHCRSFCCTWESDH